jgi:UDP-glucose 4-epimerase
MLKVLITGASGFIGRNLAELYAGRYAVTAPSAAEFNLLDAGTVRDFLCARRFDAVFHCATTRATRRVQPAAAELVERNCRMFFNLARNQNLFGKMIYLGSGAEYDRGCMPPRVTESQFDSCVPVDGYGFSKYLCAKYAERADNIFNLRIFGLFGPHEQWDVRFISNNCCRVLYGMPIVMRQNLRFDYLDVRDLADIAAWFLEHQPRYKIYNVCRGETFELLELARMVAEASGRNPEIVVKASGMGREYSGDNSRMLEEVGQFRFRDMRQSVRDLYAWYEQNRAAIDPALLRFDG